MNKFSLSLLAALVGVSVVHAQFTPGTLIVGRAGNGTTYSTSGQGGFSLYSSSKLVGAPSVAYAFPLNNGTAHTAGTNTFTTSIINDDGKLTRSPNGMFLGVAGFATSTALNDISSSSASRRIVQAPFTSNLTNNASFSFINPTTTLGGGDIHSAITLTGAGTWVANVSGLWYFASGSNVGVQILQSPEPVYSFTIAGGNIFYVGNSGWNRINGTPTTAGQIPVNLSTDSTLQMVDFIDGQNAIVASWTTDGLRKMSLSSGNWGNTSGGNALTFTTISAAAPDLSNIATDGIRAYSVEYSALDGTVLRGYPSVTGATTPVTLHTSGANTSYRGLALAPEPSIISSDYSGTSGVQRFAMRVAGTASDAYIKAVRIANVSFNIPTHRVATTVATVGYKGQIQDMAVDNNGNTLLLNVVPNATFTGYVYSIIRVSADGTQTDEGPLTSGVPSQAAPAGFMPVAIAGNPAGGTAAVLLQSTTSNQCQIGLVTLPNAIGSGVSSIANWGAYVSGTGSHQAVDVAYSTTGDLKVLFSGFSGGNGSNEVISITGSGALASTSFSTMSGIAGLSAQSLAIDSNGDARVLLTGKANGRPNQFRVDTSASGSTSPAAPGSAYTQDSSVNNTVTSQPIYSQMWAIGLNYDAGTSNPIVTFAGSNGSLNSTTLAGDQRLNIPGSFRAWRLSNTTNAAQLATYRFMPGYNLN